MTGDGLPDQVRIKNGRVEYYPNLGNGHFGAAVLMEDSPVIGFDNTFTPAEYGFMIWIIAVLPIYYTLEMVKSDIRWW